MENFPVDFFFHTLNDEGGIEYQGIVLAEKDGALLATLFSFIDGSDSLGIHVIPDWKNGKVIFYGTSQEMNDNYKRKSKR